MEIPKLRVVQWSTGGCGAIAVRVMAERDDLDLVGVWVHTADKVGRDAGELAGHGPIGVTATSDVDELLALAPDCVSYTASGEVRGPECIADFCTFLRAGINVVSTSVPGLVHPAAYDVAAVEAIEAAAAEGGASLYISGIEPGFAADHLVLVLSTLSNRIETVRTQEIFGYQDYPVAFTLNEVFGFGKPADHQALMEIPGVQASAWAPPVRMVADRLGVDVAIREAYEKRITGRDLETAIGIIPAGTVGAVRFETIGVVDGRDAIVIEHVNRMAPDLAPDWPSARRDGTYRLLVEGDPSYQCELTLGGPDDFSHHGMVATTMRIVNAIPHVCAARPGIVTSVDLPLTLPYRPFRSGAAM